MADMNLYDVDFGDFKTQMKLSDEDAESYGDRANKVGSVDVRRAIPTHHGIQLESDTGTEKESREEKASVDAKAASAPQNKSRSSK